MSPESQHSTTIRRALESRGVKTFAVLDPSPPTGRRGRSAADERLLGSEPGHVCAILDVTGTVYGEADRLGAQHRLPVVGIRADGPDHGDYVTETVPIGVLRYWVVGADLAASPPATGGLSSRPDVAFLTLEIVPALPREGNLTLRLGASSHDAPPGSGVKVRITGGELEVRLIPPFADTTIWCRSEVTVTQRSGAHTVLGDGTELVEAPTGTSLTVAVDAHPLIRHWV